MMCRFLVLVATIVLSAPTQAGEPWYRPPPSDQRGWRRLPDSVFRLVPESRIRRAVALLRSVSARALSKTEAAEYGLMASNAEATPYLLRGLYRVLGPPPNRGFFVSQHGTSVWVEQGALAGSSSPLRRWPLVVFLRVSPDTVFVTATVAR